MSEPSPTSDLLLSRALLEFNRLLADPQAQPEALSQGVLKLASLSKQDDAQVTSAIQHGIAALGLKDRHLAALTAVDASNIGEPRSALTLALQISWVHLMSPPTLAERAGLFPVVEQSFNRVLDEKFKAVIGEKVLDLAAYACVTPEGTEVARKAVSMVQAFAFSAENLSLANGAGERIAMFNDLPPGPGGTR